MRVFLSIEVAGTPDIGVIEERCLLAASSGGGFVEIVGQDGGDGAIIEGADFDSTGRYGFRPRRLDATIKPQDTKAGPEALLWMRPVGEDRGDEPLGVWADGPGPTAKAIGALNISTMRAVKRTSTSARISACGTE
jgi:hypothetical protein